MINRGQILGDTYCKKVKFSKAVLWKDRQLSIPQYIMDDLIARDIKRMLFVDGSKKETWEFKTFQVAENMVLKQEGQEPQYYFSIDLATKRKG